MEKITMATIVLGIATGAYLLVALAGVYEHAFVMPAWFKEAPKSFALIKAHEGATKFWIPLQIITLLSLIASLVLNWSNPSRRWLIAATLLIYIAVAAVSAIYFAPKIIAWGKMDTSGVISEVLTSAGQSWLSLSWWTRILPQILASILLLLACIV